MAQGKRNINVLATHSGIHVVGACVVINVGLTSRILLAIVALALIHGLLDYAKTRFTSDDWVAFNVDQAAHLLPRQDSERSGGVEARAAQCGEVYRMGGAFLDPNVCPGRLRHGHRISFGREGAGA
jgi:hypothetical protein